MLNADRTGIEVGESCNQWIPPAIVTVVGATIGTGSVYQVDTLDDSSVLSDDEVSRFSRLGLKVVRGTFSSSVTSACLKKIIIYLWRVVTL